MESEGNRGIAFITEGETERQFYDALLLHYARRHNVSVLTEHRDENYERFYELSTPYGTRIIRFNNVGTITQLRNSGSWFRNFCLPMRPRMPWTVFLCYDTDSYSADISKFYSDDWQTFRKTLAQKSSPKIIDLAAKADIEDIMLLDLHGISVYMKREAALTPDEIPRGRKGSARMKELFIQQRKLGMTEQFYHKGVRARPLIDCLDFDAIAVKSDIPFSCVEEECFL